MKKLIYSALTLLTLSLIIAGCSGETYEKKLKKEKRAINNYIADNNIKVIQLTISLETMNIIWKVLLEYI